MHLDKDLLIGEVPVKDLRRILRRLSFSTTEFLTLVPASNEEALRLLDHLLAEGYVVRSHWDESVFEPTLKGSSLGNATLRRYSRKTADKAILEMMKRVHKVNTEQEFAYTVEALCIFGSYITDRPDVGDVDVAYKLQRWSLDDAEQDRREKDRKHAHRGHFNNIVDEVTWPFEEVLRFLKSRSPLIALHDYEEPAKLKTPFIVVFNRDDPAVQEAFLRDRFNCTFQALLGEGHVYTETILAESRDK